MTEAEWLSGTNPQKMLEYLCGANTSGRKLRLLVCAICRSRSRGEAPLFLATVPIAEQFAEGLVGADALASAYNAWGGSAFFPLDGRDPGVFGTIEETLVAAVHPDPCRAAAIAVTSVLFDGRSGTLHGLPWYAQRTRLNAEKCLSAPREVKLRCGRRLTDVFGNPFRPVTCSPSWRTTNVRSLASTIYEERELFSGLFDNVRLAVLADALQDAGCDNADILNHCRQPGEHVRGCWVVDALLGKE